MERYDAECVPPEYQNNKVDYIRDSSISKNCTRYLKVGTLLFFSGGILSVL